MQTRIIGYIGIDYSDPDRITKFKDESEIVNLGWLHYVDGCEADVFRLEMVNDSLQLRKMLVEIDETKGDIEESKFKIADWELVLA